VATLTAADVQSLRDAIAAQQAALAQQQQIQELRDELHRKDQTVQQAQTAASDAAGKADAAQAAASQQQDSVAALKTDVGDLKLNLVNTVSTIQETQKGISDPPRYDGSREGGAETGRKVNKGRLQFGPQFSYVTRNTWSGNGIEPHGIDGMVFTSFRYYLP